MVFYPLKPLQSGRSDVRLVSGAPINKHLGDITDIDYLGKCTVSANGKMGITAPPQRRNCATKEELALAGNGLSSFLLWQRNAVLKYAAPPFDRIKGFPFGIWHLPFKNHTHTIERSRKKYASVLNR